MNYILYNYLPYIKSTFIQTKVSDFAILPVSLYFVYSYISMS